MPRSRKVRLLGCFANRRLSAEVLCLLQKLFLVFLDLLHGFSPAGFQGLSLTGPASSYARQFVSQFLH
jgi:hypothetical protein